jgi:hypothetical protein
LKLTQDARSGKRILCLQPQGIEVREWIGRIKSYFVRQQSTDVHAHLPNMGISVQNSTENFEIGGEHTHFQQTDLIEDDQNSLTTRLITPLPPSEIDFEFKTSSPVPETRSLNLMSRVYRYLNYGINSVLLMGTVGLVYLLARNIQEDNDFDHIWEIMFSSIAVGFVNQLGTERLPDQYRDKSNTLVENYFIEIITIAFSIGTPITEGLPIYVLSGIMVGHLYARQITKQLVFRQEEIKLAPHRKSEDEPFIELSFRLDCHFFLQESLQFLLPMGTIVMTSYWPEDSSYDTWIRHLQNAAFLFLGAFCGKWVYQGSYKKLSLKTRNRIQTVITLSLHALVQPGSFIYNKIALILAGVLNGWIIRDIHYKMLRHSELEILQSARIEQIAKRHPEFIASLITTIAAHQSEDQKKERMLTWVRKLGFLYYAVYVPIAEVVLFFRFRLPIAALLQGIPAAVSALSSYYLFEWLQRQERRSHSKIREFLRYFYFDNPLIIITLGFYAFREVILGKKAEGFRGDMVHKYDNIQDPQTLFWVVTSTCLYGSIWGLMNFKRFGHYKSSVHLHPSLLNQIECQLTNTSLSGDQKNDDKAESSILPNNTFCLSRLEQDFIVAKTPEALKPVLNQSLYSTLWHTKIRQKELLYHENRLAENAYFTVAVSAVASEKLELTSNWYSF